MAVEIENLEGLERKIILSLPWEKINQETQKKLKEAQKRAKVDGFRPGKVPMKIVESMYGASTQQDVINDIAINTFYLILETENIKIAGIQQLEALETQDDETKLKIAAIFEVYPEVKIGDFSGIEIEKVMSNVTEADVDKTIEILRKQRTSYDYADRAAQNDDRVIIDFAGTIDGVPFDGGSSENYPFVLGGGQMLPEFEAGILGMKANEVKELTVSFPEDYHGKDVAGKTAIFTITLRNVSEPKLPEVDEDFARTLGIIDGDIVKMRQEIMKNISRESKRRTDEMTKENVMKVLLEVSQFAAPNALIEQEIERLQQEAQQNFINQGWAKEQLPELPRDMFLERAENRVKLGLILAQLVEENKLEAKEEQIKAIVADLAESYEDPEEVIAYYMSDKKNLQGAASMAIEANVVDYVLANAKMLEKELSLDEVMGGQFAG